MVAESKSRMRSEVLSARRSVPEAVRRRESEQLCAHVDAVVAGAGVVCAYVPMGTEPGSAAILDVLAQRCPTVLLPVARTGPDGAHLPLRWGRYVAGGLRPGPFGTREPGEPWLPETAVSTAGVVLVPALAVDRRGVRLGRGGGFYDRSLSLCSPGTRLVAVVRDGELLDEVPGESHDVTMTHALTPGAGLIALGNTASADSGSST